MNVDHSKALVLLSGGQDSTTCLYLAKRDCESVRALMIGYGQRHDRELDAATKIAEMAGVEIDGVSIPDTLKSTSPLVNYTEQVELYTSPDDMPTKDEPTFVPCRNVLFLTIAVNHAVAHGCGRVYIGVGKEDYDGYPDCRMRFILAFSSAINLAVFGESEGVKIETPLITKNKADTVRMAHKLPGCQEALAYSHTCYDGEYPPNPRNHASILRAKGFKDAGFPDPLIVRAKSEGKLPDDYPPDGYVFGTKYDA